MKEYDVVIIGGGPAGYVAAIKAAQLGKNVICIEKKSLGGTCLNVGCIPSKALLSSSQKFYDAMKHFGDHGIEFADLKFSLGKMQARKNKVVTDLVKGIGGLFKKNKVNHINGFASFIDQHSLRIKLEDGTEQIIKASNIVIATGSEPISIPGFDIDEKIILSSTGALELSSVPQKMLILGAGVIGLEMASIWSRLGSDVTVIEHSNRILVASDHDISREMQKILEKQGIKFMPATKAIKATINGQKVILQASSADGAKIDIEADVLLIAIGRKPFTDNLGLEKIGIELDEKRRIKTDVNYRTIVPHIFAIGDVITGPMLAHKAEEEGIAVAEIISNQHGHVNYEAIPSVVYTTPEVATVGKTEDELKASGIGYKVGKFPFMANSRARTTGETDGFVKIIVCDKTDKILGVHIIGPDAGELIAEISVGIEFKAAAEDIARTSHSHPGYCEAIKEAAMAAYASAIHI